MEFRLSEISGLEAEIDFWVSELEEALGKNGDSTSFYVTNNKNQGGGTELTFTDEELLWRKDALCRGMSSHIFFPRRGESMLTAYVICYGCPVRQECLENALAGNSFGIWAGFTPGERVKIRRAMNEGKTLQDAMRPYDLKRKNKLQRAKIRERTPPLIAS